MIFGASARKMEGRVLCLLMARFLTCLAKTSARAVSQDTVVSGLSMWSGASSPRGGWAARAWVLKKS